MIEDKNDSIVRPVAMQIARQIATMLKLPKYISILFPGMWEEGINTGSTINPLPEDDPARFKYDRRFQIEVSEEPVEDRVLATAVHRRDNLPVFADDALGFYIYPITVGTNMTFTITFRAESRAEAIRFRDDILAHFAEGRTDYLHEIDYHWNIPLKQTELIKHIHDRREAVAGYGDTVDEYFVERVTKRITNVSTLIGTQVRAVVREKQISPTGFFDFVGRPGDMSKDREGKTVNVEFRYTFTYDQVVGTVAQYPLMVHGRLIDKEWYHEPRASGKLVLPDRRLKEPSMSRRYFNVVSNEDPNWRLLNYEMVRIPYFDDWSPAYVKPHTADFFQIAVGSDPTATNYDLFNFSDITEFEFDPAVLEFIRKESPRVCNYKSSIIYFELFENNDPVEDGILKLRDDLTFYTTRKLDPRKLYHIQMRFVWHLNSLTGEAMDNLRLSGQAGLIILDWLQMKLRRRTYTPKLIGGKLLDERDMVIVAENLDGRVKTKPNETYHPGLMKTVAQFSINVIRT